MILSHDRDQMASARDHQSSLFQASLGHSRSSVTIMSSQLQLVITRLSLIQNDLGHSRPPITIVRKQLQLVTISCLSFKLVWAAHDLQSQS